MTETKKAPAHPIPDEALDSDIAIIARKGSGKSYLARGLAERLLDLGRRMVVIDPLGAWWGLKALADGQHEGYPVAVFGGEHGDMLLSPSMGEPLAKLIAGDNLPCVIDTSLMRKEEQGRLAIDLFEGLFRYNKEALTIILEEADVFAPQNPAKDGYAAQVLHEVDRIARRGRARGLRLISLTQRPARLHKDVLSQAATLVAMRLSAPQDRDAIKAWVEGNADRDQAREVIDCLASLPVGTGWVWAPDLNLLTKSAFPKIKTLDTSATPKAGETRIEPKTLAEVDVSTIREALEVPSEEQEAQSRKGKAPSVNRAAIAAAQERGYQEGKQAGLTEGFNLGMDEARRRVIAFAGELATAVIGRQISDVKTELEPRRGAPSVSATTPAPAPRKSAARPPAPPRTSNGELTSNPFYQAALSVHPVRMTWPQLGALAQRKTRGGSFNTARKRLLEEGYLIEDGELVFLANPPDIPSGTIPADLLEQRLPTVPAEMFKAIRRRPGHTVQSLADELGKASRGGSWNTGMSILTKNGIVLVEGGRLEVNPNLLVAA